MNLSDLAINRPIGTLMVILLILLFGVVSWSRLNIDLFPDMSFPVVAVITSYEGVGPEEMENLVTKPLESILGTITKLKNISSTSRAGQSLVILEFNWGTDMDFATLEIREKLDLIGGRLPEGAISPMVFKFDPSMLPVAQFGLNGNYDLVELKKLSENELIPRLERIDGVASVNLIGGLTREIRIDLDQQKLVQYGLKLQFISNILRMQNLNLPSGKIGDDGTEYLIRTMGEFQSLEEIENIVIPTQTGIIHLKDVAEIRDTYKKIQNIARMNGKPSVGISIQKQADANTVKVIDEVFEVIQFFENEYSGLKVIPIMDQSRYIKDSIYNVTSNAIFGAILAVLVLFFFLKNIRSTLILGTAIPISIIATFVLIYFGGLTLNLMSLGGLALGIGMLVDNSIVVLENIYRFRQQGLDRIDAAKKGSKEVKNAILASTLTTVIVFLPVVFVEGIASQLFRELALTVTFSLLASLAIALTFIPMVSSQLLTISPIQQEKKFHEGKLLRKLKGSYKNILGWSLNRPWIVLAIAFIILAGSVMLYPLIGAEFIPEMDEGEIRISVKLPLGTVSLVTDEVISSIEENILNRSDVETLFVSIGSGENVMMTGATRSEVGELTIRLKPLSERNKSTEKIMEELREELKEIENANISIQQQGVMSSGGFLGKSVALQIHGSDLNVLKKIAEDVILQLTKVKGVREIEHSVEEGRPELRIRVDNNKAALYGLSTAQIATFVRSATQGEISTRYKANNREVDIRIQLQWTDRKDLSGVKNIILTTPTGANIPLETVAELAIEEGPGLIKRSNGMRLIEVTADLFDRDVQSANQEIQNIMKDNIILPVGYSITNGGEYREMWLAFDSLIFALILAVILVYMVLAAQFESFWHPLTIMFTLPMALAGIFISLFITGYTFSVLSLIGIIMLAGIVVNNAIVLIDYINRLRADGMERKKAILEAGPVRLRPILMTSLTTVLGLLPLALGIGEGTEIQAPMAVVVIGGLIFSTFLTLIVVPIIYLLIDLFGEKIQKGFLRLQKG
ncbi:MAG: efflux RND transporter permease subunit [Halanaerobiales bacterium]|nr:efflux RND transporter permease subunit [Halanaerobiales bacterium]